jgi:SPP1 gp7 family putative phage head morphogenesis protein
MAADPSTSIRARTGGAPDLAALTRRLFTGDVPYSEWAGRRREGADIDVQRIERVLRAADVGIMWPLADMAREMIALNPKAQGILGKGLLPLAAAPHELVAAEDGLSPQEREEAKRIANDVRGMLAGIRGLRQALIDLAFGFFDGRAALEAQYARIGTRSVPVALDWMIPQRLSFDEARRLIVVDRWGDYGQFIKRGPALGEVPGKFLQFCPRMFADLQEREGLAPRFLFWLLFDRFGWRHRMILMQKFGIPWRLVEQQIADTLAGLKLPLAARQDGGEGGAPNDDNAALDYTATEAQNVSDDGVWVGLAGQKLSLEWPPAEVHEFFSQGSDQIMDRISWLCCHNGINDAPRAAEVVLKGPEEVLFEFRAMLVAEVVQTQLVNVCVELNYGADALPLGPTWSLRTRPERDRDKEVERLGKVSLAVPIGVSTWYEVSGFPPPQEGEALAKMPTPAPFGSGPSGDPSPPAALPRDEGSSEDAIGALRDLVESDDEDGQADAAEDERSLARWFAATGRKVQPRSANGTPEVLVEKGVREGARYTSRWAEELADAGDGTTAARVYRNLSRAAQALDLEPFTRAVERRILHGLMLGGLDADYEMGAEAVIEPAEFAFVAPPILVPGVPASGGGIANFVTMPFGEAIRAFTGKRVISKRAFERLAASAKRKAFTVAHLARKDMLATAHDELAKAITAGADLREFSKALGDRFDAAGWTRLNASHVETVFRTNVMGAYSDGRRAQMTQPAVMAARPYWQILGVKDSRTRDPHRDAIGKVLPAGDPFFDRAGPPFGFNCRCRTVSRSAKDLARLGLVPTIGAQIRGLPDDGWDASGSSL